VAVEKNIIDTGAPSSRNLFQQLFRIHEIGPLCAIILLILLLGTLQPRFFLLINIFNVARQISLLCIIAIGMGFCLIAGEFDLSVGSTMGLSAIVCALVITSGYNPFLGIFLSLLSGATIGAINGVLIAKLGIPSFVVTLGFMSIGRGLALTITNGWPISIYGEKVPAWFLFLGGGKAFGIVPMQAVFMAIMLIIGFFILHKSQIGHHLYAIGGNPHAAMLYGISVPKVKIFAFVTTGFLSAMAGILAFSFIQTAEPLLGTLFELEVIAAAVIGGITIGGGHGSILAVLLGAITIGILNNGLVLLGISAFVQKTLIGCVLIVAVYFGERVLKTRE
jgi:ribose transport system permease protein